jgi:hypothetical protein
MFSRLIKANTRISEGFNRVQWLLWVGIGSSGVAYALSFFHLAILGALAPVVLIAILYLIGNEHIKAQASGSPQNKPPEAPAEPPPSIKEATTPIASP